MSIDEGYIALGLLDNAAQDPDKIPPEWKAGIEVMGMRLAVYMAAKKWEEASIVAEHLVSVQPDNAQWWISYAYATRRSEFIQAAETILLKAIELHPNEAMIHYNLACYVAQSKRILEAKVYLKKAMELDKSFGALAVEDPDLEPLWCSI